MRKISIKEFQETVDKHKISLEEKNRWWGKKSAELFTYEPKWLYKSESPLYLDYKRGTQSFVKYMEFISTDPYLCYEDKTNYFTSIMFYGKEKYLCFNIPFKENLISWHIPIRNAEKIESFKEAINFTEQKIKWVTSEKFQEAYKSGTKTIPLVTKLDKKTVKYTEILDKIDNLDLGSTFYFKEEIKKKNIPFSEEYFYKNSLKEYKQPDFNIVDQTGELEFLSQKRFLHEYYADNGNNSARLVFVAVNKKQEPRLNKDLMLSEVIEGQKHIKGNLNWYLFYTEDLKPYVLSKHAIDTDWLPMYGYSALPEFIEKQVPANLKYWEYTNKKLAETARKELVNTVKLKYEKS
ncbi:MAG: hypothetical protein ACOC5T_06650 [Elusimicrobiota bacterium]